MVRGRLVLASLVASAALLTSSGVGPASANPSPGGTYLAVVPSQSNGQWAFLQGVACGAPTNCFAVGYTRVGLGNWYDVIEQETPTGWILVTDQGPRPPGTTSMLLNGVTCVSSSDCIAVGATGSVDSQNTPIPTAAYITRWTGSSWNAMTAVTPGGAVGAELNEVSCSSAGSCLAVGESWTGSANSPLAESWNGSTWSIIANPTTPDNGFLAVSCPVAGECWTVMNNGVTNQDNAVEEWNGSTWTSAGSVTIGGAAVLILNDLKCGSASTCVLVGYQNPGDLERAVSVELTGAAVPATAVLSAPTVLPNADVNQWNDLFSVACVAADDCWAAGGTVERGGPTEQSLAAHWNGTAWTTGPSQSVASSELAGVACPAAGQCVLAGTSIGSGNVDPLIETTAPVLTPQGAGTWMVASDGGIFAFGTAPFHGSMGGRTLNRPIVSMAGDPATGGYWEVASDGGIFAFDAPFFGSMGGQTLNRPIVGMAATPDGGGYWEVASDGGIFAFGDAAFDGSMGGQPLNAPVVAILPTADGHGYRLVASDGGIFSFGNAPFAGSMGGRPLNRPIVGMALDTATGGYWEVASDGGIFAFGAPFEGSMGGHYLAQPIVSMAYDPATGGYWQVASDGGIFAFNAPFQGSMGGHYLASPIVGIAT